MKITQKFNLDIPLTIDKIIQYNKNFKKTLIIENKEEIKLLIKEIKMELKELLIKIPDVNKIRKNLKKKSKKFIISKKINIGNIVSFGANIDGDNKTYDIIMMPFIGNPLANINFRYLSKSKNIIRQHEKLRVMLKKEKVHYNMNIKYIGTKKYYCYNVEDEKDNSKFWYIIKLWAKI